MVQARKLRGQLQAMKLGGKALWVSSPLARAMQTMLLGCPHSELLGQTGPDNAFRTAIRGQALLSLLLVLSLSAFGVPCLCARLRKARCCLCKMIMISLGAAGPDRPRQRLLNCHFRASPALPLSHTHSLPPASHASLHTFARPLHFLLPVRGQRDFAQSCWARPALNNGTWTAIWRQALSALSLSLSLIFHLICAFAYLACLCSSVVASEGQGLHQSCAACMTQLSRLAQHLAAPCSQGLPGGCVFTSACVQPSSCQAVH